MNDNNSVNLKNIISIKNAATIKNYIDCDILLLVDDEVFDTEYDEKYSKKIRDRLSDSYFRYIEKLCPEEYTIIVKVSGLHFDFVDFLKDYTFAKNSRNHLILHYHHWRIDESETIDEDAYVLIECDRSLFKELFDRYWFSINVEYHFEGIVLAPDDVIFVEKWVRLDEADSQKAGLINRAFMCFDNLQNGFHFRITGNKKNKKLYIELPCF